MNPILTVEFTAKAGDIELKEESVTLNDMEEFFAFVSSGGGCDSIPSEVDEIKMVFLPPLHPNTRNPLADKPVTLQLGMVFFNGPLSVIVHTAQQILDKAGRDELSESFLTVIGAGTPSR